jgi:hypothetical protein
MKCFLLQIAGGFDTEYKADFMDSLYVTSALDSVSSYVQERLSIPLGTL